MFSQCLSATHRALSTVSAETFMQYNTGKMFRCPQQSRLLSRINRQAISVGDIIKYWTTKFTNKGIPEPVESIEHILAYVLGTRKVHRLAHIQGHTITQSQYQKLFLLCEYRLARMPVQYIIRQWDFWDITLKLVPPIFIPRPETEILVHYVSKTLQSYDSNKQKILDIGCGSGAISLALAHASKKVRCIAVDVNPEACKLTLQNRDNLHLKHRVAVMHAVLKDDGSLQVLSEPNESNELDLNSETFDCIVSNPPYIPTKQIATLPPEIKIYEDLTALDGGDDGLKVIKPLLKYAATALKPGGHLFLEVDTTHPEYIQLFIKKYPALKLQYQHTLQDMCNNNRFVQILKLL